MKKTVEQVIFEEKRLIPDVNIFISDGCNLNCESCMNFSPLAKQGFLDVDMFEKDIKQFAKIAGEKVARIDLMGGEPLLHPDLCKIMRIVRSYFPTTNIAIETNGILLFSQSEEFWKTCSETGIIVRVSRYPRVNSVTKLRKLAKEKNAIFRMCDGADEWMQKNGKVAVIETNGGALDWKTFPLDKTGSQNREYNYQNCEQHCCCALSEGKFFPCTKIPNIKHFNKYFGENFEVSKNDYIDIYKAENADDILRFMDFPVDFCRYCNVKNEKDLKWARTSYKKEEWL